MSVCDILKDLASPVIMVRLFSKLDKIDKKKLIMFSKDLYMFFHYQSGHKICKNMCFIICFSCMWYVHITCIWYGDFRSISQKLPIL